MAAARARADGEPLNRLGPLAAAAAFLLSACGGAASLPPPTQPDQARHAVSVRMIIPARAGSPGSSRARRPSFISAATLGVQIEVRQGASLATSTLVDLTVADVSPGSAACGGSVSSPRTCTGVSGLVPHGTYYVVARTYDQAPASGAIPGGAHELAYGALSGVVVLDRTASNVTIYVGGDVTTYGNSAAFVSLSGNGSPQLIGFALNPKDYANETIVAGTNDPYSNPITLTVSETGGSGHATLKLNGASVGTSATVTKSTDAVQVSYDGGGAAGYYATVAISATGVATTNVNVSPMFVALSAYATGNTVNFLAAGQTSTASITEAGAPGTVTYSVGSASCTNVASAGAVSGSGAAASVVVTAGPTGATGCTMTITDNVGSSASLAVNVTNTITNANVGVPGGYTEFTVPGGGGVGNLDQIRLGADGRLWFAEFGSATVDAMDASGTVSRYATASPSSNPTFAALGPDGRMWYAQNSALFLGAMKTDGTTVGYPLSQAAVAVAAGPDGRMWFSEGTASVVGVMTTAGTGLTEYALGIQCGDIEPGPDGRMWALDQNLTSRVYAIGTGANGTVPGALTTYTAGITAGTFINRIAAGPDGAMWFTEAGARKIGRITTTGTVTEYAVASGTPKGIVAGLDGSMWFSVGGKTIGKVGTGLGGTTLGAVTTFAGTVALGMSGSGTSGIAVGPDGNLWVVERNTNGIAKFIP